MVTLTGTWPDSTDTFWIIKDGNNIRVKSEKNTGITRSVILDSSDYPELTQPLRIFQRGIDLEFVPQACVDYDGNIYDAIKISGEDDSGSTTRQINQLWTIQNLKATHNRLGKLIQIRTTQSSSPSIYQPSVLWPEEYGIVYNWYAAHGSENDQSDSVIPEGWRLPSQDDYTTLSNFLRGNLSFSSDGETELYLAKAACSKNGWNTTTITYTPGCNRELNNTSLLGLTPSGYWVSGASTSVGDISRYWLSDNGSGGNNYARWWGYSNSTQYNKNLIYSSSGMVKAGGAAVRCVKDISQ